MTKRNDQPFKTNYPNDINIGTNVALLHTIKIHQISWSFFSHFIENKFLLNFKLNSKSETEEIFTLLKERNTSDSCPKYSGICVPKLNIKLNNVRNTQVFGTAVQS